MVWVCKVCSAEAKYIADFGTSKINKKGNYSISRMGYCERHKPIVMTTDEYLKMRNLKIMHMGVLNEK